MKCPSILLVVLLGLATLLSGCTGTSEETVQTLLVVGYNPTEDQGAIALIEDLGDIEEGFNLLEASVRLLDTGSIVGYDIVDRTNTREQLVVLTRDESATGEGAFLTFINLAGVDPMSPTAFAPEPPVGDPELPAVISIGDLAPELEFCPVAVQVDSTGRFIALLNDPTACGDTGGVGSIDIIDLQAVGGPLVLVRIDLVQAFPVLPTSFLLSQDTDRLYFFVERPGGSSLRFVDLNDLEDLEDVPPGDTGILIPTTAGEDVVDVDRVGLEFVALLDTNRFAVFSPLEPTEEVLLVESENNNRSLLNDDLDATDAILILGANQLTVHELFVDEAGDPDFSEESISLTPYVDDPSAGMIESFNGFAYIAGDESIAKFDVLSYDVGDELRTLIGGADVPGLINPVFITWTRALVEAPTP